MPEHVRKIVYRIAFVLAVGMAAWARYGFGWGWFTSISWGAIAFFPAVFIVSTVWESFKLRSMDRRAIQVLQRIERDGPIEELSDDEIFDQLLGPAPQAEKAKS